ncbi:MAG: hypothetical protein HY259_06030 [Chloroflexi bacterium]|nr:hypothetical protein [Chloroflexota bacterium]MBI3733002.1 hypothetical protein [Chloroflexota bacterium]
MPRQPITLRPSAADPDARVINNLPGRFSTEDWRVYYWDTAASGELRDRHCIIQLPLGSAAHAPPITIGEPGMVLKVRRWGVTISSGLFELIGFDPQAYLTHDAQAYPGGDDEEIVDVVMRAVNFDLPSEFVIASDEHPFLLFDPAGELKGSYTKGHSYLGALAYHVSKGRTTATFNTMRHFDRELYDRAVNSLLRAL